MSTPVGVPLCDLQAQFRTLEPELEAAAMRVLRSCQVIGGPEVSAFESEAARYCGAAHAVGCSSGSDALLLALAALGIGPGDEVILPPFTFFASVGAVCRLGAHPVFADIDPVSFNVDPAEVASKITPRTRAIMVVHLFGQTADMDAIGAIAQEHGLPIVEDAAQAIGAEYRGKRTGTLGTVACFSFYPSKNLGAYGDAGMAVTDDGELAARIACLRTHGMEPRYHHKYLGWNARLDALQAALLRVKLPYLDSWADARQGAARRYDALIEEQGLESTLLRPTVGEHRRHVFNQYVVRVGRGQRDALLRHFRAEKIGCEVYYPIPLHLQECLRHLGHHEGDFPVSEQACRSVLALPMFPEIAPAQQLQVVSTCAGLLQRPSRMAA
jgi:dTDP-4-amino-4,6-dideoxygalactose transaminase